MRKNILLAILLLSSSCITIAQEAWPRVLKTKDGGKITVYQPQPEKLEGNIVSGRTAVSISQKAGSDPVFGATWFTAELETNRDNRMAVLQKVKINHVKIPGIEDSAQINSLKKLLEEETPKWKLATTIDEIAASVEQEQNNVTDNFKNDAPAIIYTTKYSALIIIDGEPKLENDDKLKMKRVINTAFLIVQSPKDNQYYLFGGSSWYSSNSILSGWKHIAKLPKEIQELDKELQINNEASSNADGSDVPSIVISTKPAELIQSKGEANLSSISGTNLLYVSNTEDNIFMDISTNKYYVLLSGRWYTSTGLNGPWNYVTAGKLPADFAKIPKGSEKDAVLASVPGTEEAHDALIDAQIPQTAKVDRKTATCTVAYNGEPQFEKIEGTNLLIAKNTSSTVIKSAANFYCVENGVWFKSSNAKGPWAVSDDRPKDVENIPPASEAYNIKYVYIYETTPQFVYVGYTPGYMGCYVYGPVVIYGTGYYYNPWYGVYYYPRPVTYGFSVHYNPFTGWSMGFHYSTGFFSFHVHVGGYHGFWGPPMYRPPYYPRYRGGIYGGRPPVHVGGDVNINIDNSKNIYANRNGIAASDIKRNAGNNKPTNSSNAKLGQPGNLNNNDVMLDRNGNIYKAGQKGNWQQRDAKEWKPVNTNAADDLNKQMQSRERSMNSNRNYNNANAGKSGNARKH